MCGHSQITLVIYCLLSFPATLCAQNTPANLNYPQNLFIGKTGLFQQTLPGPKNIFVKPIEIPGYEPREEYKTPIADFNKPPYPLVMDSGLIHIYRHGLKSPMPIPAQQITQRSRHAIIDRKVFYALYNKPRLDEKKKIRQAWKEAFGFDVWYPYYKTKDVEDWVKEKLSVRVFRLKGKPSVENNQILYVFSTRF